MSGTSAKLQAEAESEFVRELIFQTVNAHRVRTLLGKNERRHLLDEVSDGAVMSITGQIDASQEDLYGTGNDVIVKYEEKVLAWARKNLSPDDYNVCISIVIICILIGAAPSHLDSYLFTEDGKQPALPRGMALMEKEESGNRSNQVPGFGDIVKAIAAATEESKAGISLLTLHLCVESLISLPSARAHAEKLIEFDDRSEDVEDRIRAILSTVPVDALAKLDPATAKVTTGTSGPPRKKRPHRSLRPRMF